MQYYNPKIQIHRDVIVDVFSNFTPNSKHIKVIVDICF